MAIIRCDDVPPIYWAYVTEYANRLRIDRCKALLKIIEEHAKFLQEEHEMRYSGGQNAQKKTKTKKK